jgi:hypothetical protein
MNDIKHISSTDLYAFHHDIMKHEERQAFLEHICSCNYCSNQFAASMSEHLIKAPQDLKANLLKTVKLPEVQITAKVKETSRRMQLFIYSLKVGAATIAALFLLLISVNLTNYAMSPDKWTEDTVTEAATDKEGYVPLTAVIRDNMDAISNSILDFSNTIMNTEVKNND